MLHTVLGVAPGAMLFRDDKHTHFARKPITEENCIRELEPKTMVRKNRQSTSSKYKTKDKIGEGDKVFIRNYSKHGKFNAVNNNQEGWKERKHHLASLYQSTYCSMSAFCFAHLRKLLDVNKSKRTKEIPVRLHKRKGQMHSQRVRI